MEEAVLKDPFKKAIPTNSKLLAYGPQSDKENQEVAAPGLTPVERVGVIGGTVSLVVVLLYCLHRYTTWRPCSNFIPNLKSFSAYKKSERKSATEPSRQKSSKENATERPATATLPPEQLALLSTVV